MGAALHWFGHTGNFHSIQLLVDLCSMSMGKHSGLTELVLCLWIEENLSRDALHMSWLVLDDDSMAVQYGTNICG